MRERHGRIGRHDHGECLDQRRRVEVGRHAVAQHAVIGERRLVWVQWSLLEAADRDELERLVLHRPTPCGSEPLPSQLDAGEVAQPHVAVDEALEHVGRVPRVALLIELNAEHRTLRIDKDEPHRLASRVSNDDVIERCSPEPGERRPAVAAVDLELHQATVIPEFAVTSHATPFHSSETVSVVAPMACRSVAATFAKVRPVKLMLPTGMDAAVEHPTMARSPGYAPFGSALAPVDDTVPVTDTEYSWCRLRPVSAVVPMTGITVPARCVRVQRHLEPVHTSQTVCPTVVNTNVVGQTRPVVSSGLVMVSVPTGVDAATVQTIILR